MKKTLLALSLLTLFACSEAPKEENIKKAEEAVQKIETVSVEKTPIEEPVKIAKIVKVEKVVEKDIFKDYSDINTKANDPELQKLIDASIAEYEVLVDQVRDTFKKTKEEAKKERIENIKEMEQGLEEQKKVYDLNCTEIDAQNQKSCNKIGAGNSKIENQINKMKANLSNEIKKLETAETNQLKSYQAKLKTNLSKLLSQDK